MDGNAGCRQKASNLGSEIAGGESKGGSTVSPEAGRSGPPGQAEGMERIRVRARTLDGKAVSMVGLLPRDVLDDLKARISRLERQTGKHYHLEAHLKPAAAAEVLGGREMEGPQGLKVVVGVAIKEDSQDPEPPGDSGAAGDSREETAVKCEATGA